MRYKEISEARRNPNQNPRIYALEQLKKYVDQDELYYISYTHIEKIGINPRSPYNTPIGVYTYPLTPDIFAEMEKKGTSSAVPFAGEGSFIWVLKAETKDILWLGRKYYTNENYRNDIVKFENYFVGNKIMGEDEFRNKVKEYSQRAYHKTPTSKLWALSGWMANHLGSDSRHVVRWNWLFRNVLNYQVAVDLGSSTIHEGEPTQAVFFSKDAFSVVEKIKNVDEYSGANLARNGKLNLKDPVAYVTKPGTPPSQFNSRSLTLPTDVQQQLIKKNPDWVTKIKNLDPMFVKILKKYIYIVDEPGFTDLETGQLLTQKQYNNASAKFGDDAFTVKQYNH